MLVSKFSSQSFEQGKLSFSKNSFRKKLLSLLLLLFSFFHFNSQNPPRKFFSFYQNRFSVLFNIRYIVSKFLLFVTVQFTYIHDKNRNRSVPTFFPILFFLEFLKISIKFLQISFRKLDKKNRRKIHKRNFTRDISFFLSIFNFFLC